MPCSMPKVQAKWPSLVGILQAILVVDGAGNITTKGGVEGGLVVGKVVLLVV